jgi:hypothetical protein
MLKATRNAGRPAGSIAAMNAIIWPSINAFILRLEWPSEPNHACRRQLQ